MDYVAITRCRANDAAYFVANPERVFRCRRMDVSELRGEPPDGYRCFVIIHRTDVEHYWNHVFFGAPVWFDENLSDAQCRAKLRERAELVHA